MRILALFVSLLLVVGVTIGADAPNPEEEKLNAFFQEEWDWDMKESPVTATLNGDYRFNDQLDDYSLAAVKLEQQHNQESLKKLESFNRSSLSPSGQLNYDLYKNILTRDIEGEAFPFSLMPINQMGGVQQNLPQLSENTPFRNLKDYQDYLSRLNQVSRAVDQTMDVLKKGLADKILPPKVPLRDVAEQIQAQIVKNSEDSAFYIPFKKFPDSISTADQQALREAAKKVISEQISPAYQRLYAFWTEQYYPKTRDSIGLSALQNGQAWYAYNARYATTTNLTPEQIHQIGLNEVKRIRAEMEKIIQETGFKGTFEEFLTYLRTDPKFYYTKAEDLVTGYRDICKRIDPQLIKLFGTLPRLPYGVREIPSYAAPSQTTAYYNQGSPEGGRPGWYYVNTYMLNMRPKWEMEALSIHESVPGHHFQIAIAQELPNVPMFRRYADYTAFVEGWALYSESLGPELEMYKDPYSKFGQLTYDMWRAVRLVVDTGMHVMNWDRQKAIDFFKANSSKSEHDITVEIDRYIVWPGQALAYKIGQLKIKELRAYSEKELGNSFNIREFHDRILGNGAVPLDILEKEIKNYVAAKKTSSAN